MSQEAVKKTLKRGRVLFYIIAVMGTVFSLWGLQFFILNEPMAEANLITHVMFSVMGFLTFLYGFRFVKNYKKTRRAELKKYDIAKRQEAMVVATAIQLLLIEFICIIGMFLAIFLQNQVLIYPFYGLFLMGLYFSYPKADWYTDILEG